MKVFKLEVMIIEEDVETIEEAMSIIDDNRYSNHVNVSAITCREAEIGEWDDDNPLNDTETQVAEMNRLFPADKQEVMQVEEIEIDENNPPVKTKCRYCKDDKSEGFVILSVTIGQDYHKKQVQCPCGSTGPFSDTANGACELWDKDWH